MLFSTRSPPAIQRIPWPTRDDSEEEDPPQLKTLSRYDNWVLDDQELPWLVEPDGEYTGFPGFMALYLSKSWGLSMLVTVTKVLHSRQGVETWVTSDGRAYFVELNEISASDLGGVDHLVCSSILP